MHNNASIEGIQREPLNNTKGKTGSNPREEPAMTEVKVNCSASSAPQLQSLSFHTRVCSLGKVELLSCWLDCLGLAHLKETARKITVKKKLLESFC